MKNIKFNVLTLFTIILLASGINETRAAIGAEFRFVYDVIQRTIPGIEKHIILEKIETAGTNDVFELETKSEKLIIRGTSGVAMTSGFNYYLKNYCNVHISWCGKQVKMPEQMPPIKEKIRIETPYQNRYYLNYCTFGYAMAFWDWERWEQEIDWMALQGINMPLAITGHEVVMMNVYKQLNLTREEIKNFISGPSFLPWFMMGNLDGFGGPLPDIWFEEQEALQKKILERQRALGMRPVLPAFTGHVPEQILKYFPDAKITQLNSWGGFKGAFILSAEDDLFQKIGQLYITETIKLFGTDHLYSADTFNEMDPPTDEPSYLMGVSKAVYTSMNSADPEAIWVMQGWLFLHSDYWKQEQINALLAGAPDDKMIILDLFSTAKPVWNKTEAYNGKPWIWNMLHNWGGKQGMYGRATRMINDLPAITKNSNAGNVCGIGLTPEGIEVNPVMFDLFGTLVWENETIDLNRWTTEYVKRRYGADNPNLQKAWNILINTIYSCETLRHGPQGSYFAMRPTPDFKEGPFARANIFYDVENVKEALKLFIQAADEFKHSETFRYDIVDLTRQAMSDKSQELLSDLEKAYKEKNIEAFKTKSNIYLKAIKDLDLVLSSDSKFLTSSWLNKARNRAHNMEQLKLYEFNARNLITLWGDKNSTLKDYAQRQYGGMMGDFNYKRWELFFNDAIASLESNKELDWNVTDAKICEWEEVWANSTYSYSSQITPEYLEHIENVFDIYFVE